MTDETVAPAESPAPLSPERLAEIRARHAATTPGQWRTFESPDDGPLGIDGKDGLLVCSNNGLRTSRYGAANNRFIARAHEDIPDLLAEIDRLTAAYTELQEASKAVHRFIDRDEPLTDEEVDEWIAEAADRWERLLAADPSERGAALLTERTRLLEALQIAVGTLLLIRSAETYREAHNLAFDGMGAAVEASGLEVGSFTPDAAKRALDPEYVAELAAVRRQQDAMSEEIG